MTAHAYGIIDTLCISPCDRQRIAGRMPYEPRVTLYWRVMTYKHNSWPDVLITRGVADERGEFDLFVGGHAKVQDGGVGDWRG